MNINLERIIIITAALATIVSTSVVLAQSLRPVPPLTTELIQLCKRVQ